MSHTERVPVYSGPEGTVTIYTYAAGFSALVKRIDGSQAYKPNFVTRNGAITWAMEQLVGPYKREDGRSHYPWGETE